MSHDPRHPDDRRDALSSEERALADQLARMGPQGEPSAALDARILGAARAALEAPITGNDTRVARRRARRRWPVAIGAAATLVIVGGLAWQLRPVDDLQVSYSEAPRAVSGPSADATADERTRAATPAAASVDTDAIGDVDTADAPAAAVAPAAREAQPDAAPVGARAPTADESRRATPKPIESESAPLAPAAPAAVPQPVPPPSESPVVFDQPSPMDTPAPPPAPPPPPTLPAPKPVARDLTTSAGIVQPAAEAAGARPDAVEPALRRQQAVQEAAATRAAKSRVATGTRVRSARSADAGAAADASVLDRIEVTGTRVDRFGDQPVDDQPPASADSPDVQRAWLQRVRQLVAAGALDEARASLHEYQRRYPDAVLPEDLRTLQDR